VKRILHVERADWLIERFQGFQKCVSLACRGEGWQDWVLLGGSISLGVVCVAACCFLFLHTRKKSALRKLGKEGRVDRGDVREGARGRRESVGVGVPSEWQAGEADRPRLEGPCGAWDADDRDVDIEEAVSEERFWERLRGRLSKTQDQLVGRIDKVLFKRGLSDQGVLEELEEVLVTADLGVKTSCHLLAEVQSQMRVGKLTPEQLKEVVRKRIEAILQVSNSTVFDPDRVKPFVMMVVGVNGVGKTTTIGKLAALLGSAGKRRVMLVAADTFRPAAIEQLEVWSRRVGSDFLKHQEGSDPSAVAYDAIHASISRGSDVVLVDTAGRLHTKTNLIEELKKLKRVITRELEGAPHEVLLVLDANTGQNAIHQARIFHESLGVTGIVLTKLDGTAKGGIIVGICHELQLPVRFIGIGERTDDLRRFEHKLFSNALFSEGASREDALRTA